MLYRTLGKTNLKVSAIGFGAWAIGGDMWGPQDDKDSIAAINKAIDLGVNFIDTALAYGKGHSEKVIGGVLKERRLKRENIIIATKIPPLMWIPGPDSHSDDAFPEEKIISSVEQSLRNLNIDYIDLIQLHSWRKNWTNDTKWHETLIKLKKAGKVRYIGISVHDNLEDEALDLIEKDRVDSIQVVYNVLSQTPRINLFPKALKYNIGIIARVPLAYGALTGKFDRNTTFSESDFRSRHYNENKFISVLKKVEDYKLLLNTSDKKVLVSAALHFALNHEAISTCIPGIRNTNQAIENCSIFEEGNLTSKKILEELQLTSGVIAS